MRICVKYCFYLSVLFVCSWMHGQGPMEGADRFHKNILRWSPVHLVGEYTAYVSYERMLGSEGGSSLNFSLGYAPLKRFWGTVLPTGYRAELQYRHYFVRPSADQSPGHTSFGFYVAPQLGFRHREVTFIGRLSFIERVDEITAGVVMGGQLRMSRCLYLDGYLGAGYKQAFGEVQDRGSPLNRNAGVSMVLPRGGLSIGIGF